MLDILFQRLSFLHHKSAGFMISFPQCLRPRIGRQSPRRFPARSRRRSVEVRSHFDLNLDVAMFPSLSSLFFVFILFIYEAYATPLPQNTDTVLSPTSAGYLAVGLCLPFIILAVLKYAYLKFRRAQTIHNSTCNGSPENCVLSPSVSIHEKKSPLVGLGLEASSVSAAGVLHLSPDLVSEHPIKTSNWRILRMGTPSKVFWPFGIVKVDIQAYLVGFLGSPEWETRIKVRRDKVARKDLASCSTLVISLHLFT